MHETNLKRICVMCEQFREVWRVGDIHDQKSTYHDWFWKRTAVWTDLAQGLSEQLRLGV